MKKIIEMLKKALKINIFVLFAILALSQVAYADECKETYGGEECEYEREYKIEKKVRIKGDKTWEDKVTDVDKDETVEFRIRVKNTGNVEVDDMKIKDELPEELKRVGGDELEERWNDFDPDETKEFIIEVQVKDSEYEDENFDKCVVNKVKLYQDGDRKGSDTATVCYGNGEVTELPETGPAATGLMTVLGLGLMATGTLVRKVKLA